MHAAAAQSPSLVLVPLNGFTTEHEIPSDADTISVDINSIEHNPELDLLVVRGTILIQGPRAGRRAPVESRSAYEARYNLPPPPPPGMGSVPDVVLAMQAYATYGQPRLDGTFIIALPLSSEYLEEHLPGIEIS